MRRLFAQLVRLALAFVIGAAAGYYVRGQRQDDEIRTAAERAREEVEAAGLEAIERAREAGSGLVAGAEAAAESAKAAFRELIGRDDR